MINEYLFLSAEGKDTITEIAFDGVKIDIEDIGENSIWIAKISVQGNGITDAKLLSDIHTKIMNIKPEPQTLTCESSEYFNKALFPKINTFERLLRKLLYVAVSLSDNEKAKESILRFEDEDLGTIFDLLFVDVDFIKSLKQRVNAEKNSPFNGRDKYTKKEIVNHIDSLQENTLWSQLLGVDKVPSLVNNFRTIKDYRNAVMHARNIDKTLFGKAEYLFDKVNKELIKAIETLIGKNEEKDEKIEINSELNTQLITAFQKLESERLSEAISSAQKSLSKAMLGVSEQLSEIQKSFNYEFLHSAIEPLSKLKNMTVITPEQIKMLDSIKNMVSPYEYLLQPNSKTEESKKEKSNEQNSNDENKDDISQEKK